MELDFYMYVRGFVVFALILLFDFYRHTKNDKINELEKKNREFSKELLVLKTRLKAIKNKEDKLAELRSKENLYRLYRGLSQEDIIDWSCLDINHIENSLYYIDFDHHRINPDDVYDEREEDAMYCKFYDWKSGKHRIGKFVGMDMVCNYILRMLDNDELYLLDEKQKEKMNEVVRNPKGDFVMK